MDDVIENHARLGKSLAALPVSCVELECNHPPAKPEAFIL